MDVCARGRVTVCIAPQNGDPEVVVVDPIAEREDIYRVIVDRLAVKTGS